jgi:hypothetical protein
MIEIFTNIFKCLIIFKILRLIYTYIDKKSMKIVALYKDDYL